MSARPCVDFMQQLLSLVDGNATHQNTRSAPFVKISTDEDEGFCSVCDAVGFCLVGWEFAFHDPLEDWEPPIGILRVGLWQLVELHDLLWCWFCGLLFVEADGRGVLVARKDPALYRLPVGGCLCKGVGRFVVPSQYVVELEAVELVHQFTDCPTIGLHLRVQAAFLLHHLVDNELRISSDLEAANPELECDPEPVEEGFVLCDAIGGREV